MTALTYKCPECGDKIPFDFTPERPTPVCSNPSSPAYSDCGDAAEVDCQFEFCPNCNEKITDQQLEEAGYKAMED